MNILWQLWISLCFSYVRAAKLLLYLCEIITFFRGKKTRNWSLAIWWVLTLLLNFLLLLEFVEKLWPILNRVFSNQYLLFFSVSVSKKNILILKSFFILFILHLVPFYLSTLSSISLHFHFYNII